MTQVICNIAILVFLMAALVIMVLLGFTDSEPRANIDIVQEFRQCVQNAEERYEENGSDWNNAVSECFEVANEQFAESEN